MKNDALAQAYAYCREITEQHYENFPVASVLLPGQIRKHIYPIYAFARHADDLADEAQDRAALLAWRQQLHRTARGTADHPIFLALHDTRQRFDLPLALFDDLLRAFLQDLEKNRYRDFDELLAYCRCSANPVGRIILRLHGYRRPELFEWSDKICTALQLTNFWQDVRIDIGKDRIYIPIRQLSEFGISEDDIRAARFSTKFGIMMKSLVERTAALFAAGAPLLPAVKKRLRWELNLTMMGGMAILNQIRRQNYNVLAKRPELRKTNWIMILLKSVLTRGVL